MTDHFYQKQVTKDLCFYGWKHDAYQQVFITYQLASNTAYISIVAETQFTYYYTK